MQFCFKIILLGDGGVGKTCIVNRLCFNEFSLDTKLTIGVAFNTYTLNAKKNGRDIQIGLSIWDFGGQQQFRPLLPRFINGAIGAIYVFDLTAFHSLDNLLKFWKPLLQENSSNLATIMVGTKKDLCDEMNTRPIPNHTLQDYIQKLGITQYYEASSKTGENIANVFQELVAQIIKLPPYDRYKIEIVD